MRGANTYGANLSPSSSCAICRAVANPHARSASKSLARNAVVSNSIYYRLLKNLNISAKTDAQFSNVKNRVADNLPRAVKGDISTSVDMEKLRP